MVCCTRPKTDCHNWHSICTSCGLRCGLLGTFYPPGLAFSYSPKPKSTVNMKQCENSICENIAHAKGYCSKHYSQLIRAGRISTSWKHSNKRNSVIVYSKNGAYKSWQHMKDRCYDPAHPSYKYYGGRGIKVCERWLNSFTNFLTDMGDRPGGMTLDRVDNSGNYASNNCRWVSWKTQANNRRKVYAWL